MTLRAMPQLLLCLLCLGAVCVGQDNKLLSKSELKAIAGPLEELRELNPRDPKHVRKIEDAEKKLEKAIEKAQKKHGEKLLLQTDSWTDLYYLANEADKIRASGLGRTKENKVGWGNGRYGAEYQILLPKAYKKQDRWPLILALPPMDEDAESQDGRRYIEGTWMDKSVPSELREQFIIMAISFGERVHGSAKQRLDRRKLDDIGHMTTIGQCMADVLTKYNVDTDRVFLDGTGQGGATAVELAVALPNRFAGVITRGGVPGSIQQLRNLANLMPLMVVHRAGGVYTTDTGKIAKAAIEKASQEYGLEVVWHELAEASPRGFDNYVEASEAVAKLLGERRRQSYTDKLYFVTDNIRYFKRSTWVRFDRADASPATGTVASVEATVDRENNVIDITSSNVESMRVYLHNDLVDLSRPIKVKVNGEVVVEETIEPSLDYLMRFAKDNPLDPGQIVVGELRVAPPFKESAETEDK